MKNIDENKKIGKNIRFEKNTKNMMFGRKMNFTLLTILKKFNKNWARKNTQSH